jgi:SPP1 gp7 family putative phage head morphogenesis protein
MITLPPIKESASDFESIEKHIKELFKREVYFPLLRELKSKVRLTNAAKPSALVAALFSGRITFNLGIFSGRFNAAIAKELSDLGAQFDRRSGCYRLHFADIPRSLKAVISASDYRFQLKLKKMDEKLDQILPGIAEKLKIESLFDRIVHKVESKFQDSVKNIVIAPTLTAHAKARISDQWSNNMQLWIKDFSEKEIKKLRSDLRVSAYAGNRYGSAVKAIQASYGVTSNKAKFLARQETSLLMTKLKQVRYQDSGVDYYKWVCIHDSKVRQMHKRLDGKVFRWDTPPIVNEKGERKNPGQDFGCRCFARPIVGYSPGKTE